MRGSICLLSIVLSFFALSAKAQDVKNVGPWLSTIITNPMDDRKIEVVSNTLDTMGGDFVFIYSCDMGEYYMLLDKKNGEEAYEKGERVIVDYRIDKNIPISITAVAVNTRAIVFPDQIPAQDLFNKNQISFRVKTQDDKEYYSTFSISMSREALSPMTSHCTAMKIKPPGG